MIPSPLEGIGARIRHPLPEGKGTGGLHLYQPAPLNLALMPSGRGSNT
jgi:hypothetical protein